MQHEDDRQSHRLCRVITDADQAEEVLDMKLRLANRVLWRSLRGLSMYDFLSSLHSLPLV